MSARKSRLKTTRRKSVPLDYIEASPDGNREGRRMFARQQKARARGREAGHGTGAGRLPSQWPATKIGE